MTGDVFWSFYAQISLDATHNINNKIYAYNVNTFLIFAINDNTLFFKNFYFVYIIFIIFQYIVRVNNYCLCKKKKSKPLDIRTRSTDFKTKLRYILYRKRDIILY